LESALDKAGQPVNFGTMAHDHEIYMALADSAAELRDEAALDKYAPQLEKLAQRDDHKLYLAIAHRTQGIADRLAGRYAEAEIRLKQALDLFTGYGARWQAGRTLFELGELNLVRLKEKTAAREYFLQALGSFEEIQARPYAEQAHKALHLVEIS
jgi:hypothetical protein